MKKIVLVIVLFFSFSFQIKAQWFWQNPFPQGHNLNTVEIFSNNTFIAAGAQGTIIRSSDDGSTWQLKQLENTLIEFTASFTNGINKIWLAGIDNQNVGKVYYSEDYGINWNLISSIPFLKFENFFLFDEQNAFASYDSAVYKSNDGCLNWYKCPIPQLTSVQDIYFINSQTGWMVAYPFKLYKTTNGGLNWDSLSIPNLPYYADCTDMFFLNENNGWMIVDGYKFLKTTDGGVNWELNTSYNNSLTNLLFIDESNGFFSGYDGEIYRTNDAGNTITIVYQPDGKKKTDIAVNNNSNKMWAVGENGSVVRSNDNGNYWVTKSSGFYFNHFTGMQLTSRNTGFVSGDDKILKTTDGGNNWIICFEETNLLIHSMYFLNSDLGWAITTHLGGYDGKLWKTTNGGNNWENIWESSPVTQNKIFFVDSLYGWINFYEGLCRTTDGGYTWNTISYNDFTNLYFTSRDIGWASSYVVNGFDINGIISKTTDGGLNWIPIVEDSLDLINDIKFFDNNFGVAVGGNNILFYSGKDNFLVTYDGGITWQKKSFDVVFKRIHFIDSLQAIATVAENGIDKIIYTSDAGNTWEDQFVFSHGDFDGLGTISFVDSDNGWILGTFSTLLHTTNGGVTFIEEEENNFTQPKEFLLEQNYPNPFNPSTKISWQSPVGSWQTLKVYDILGNEIAVLVNEYRDAGNYETEFKSTVGSLPTGQAGHQLANGVYFYRLQVGDPSSSSGQSFVETKKMILLK